MASSSSRRTCNGQKPRRLSWGDSSHANRFSLGCLLGVSSDIGRFRVGGGERQGSCSTRPASRRAFACTSAAARRAATGLTADLAASSGMLIHGLALDDAACERVRTVDPETGRAGPSAGREAHRQVAAVRRRSGGPDDRRKRHRVAIGRNRRGRVGPRAGARRRAAGEVRRPVEEDGQAVPPGAAVDAPAGRTGREPRGHRPRDFSRRRALAGRPAPEHRALGFGAFLRRRQRPRLQHQHDRIGKPGDQPRTTIRPSSSG